MYIFIAFPSGNRVSRYSQMCVHSRLGEHANSYTPIKGFNEVFQVNDFIIYFLTIRYRQVVQWHVFLRFQLPIFCFYMHMFFRQHNVPSIIIKPCLYASIIRHNFVFIEFD